MNKIIHFCAEICVYFHTNKMHQAFGGFGWGDLYHKISNDQSQHENEKKSVCQARTKNAMKFIESVT